MARNNKYSSVNFNDIYEKKIGSITTTAANKHSTLPSSAAPSKTILSNSHIHGHMLVLSRPAAKPITPQPPQHHSYPPQPQPQQPDQTQFELDSISLRPLGRTRSGPALPFTPSPLTPPKPDKELAGLPKSDRFVPPHLRPGFVGREEKPGFEFQKGCGAGHRQGYHGSLNRHGEDGRSKSGGGYERMRTGGELDLGEMNRPGSGGTRPSSSG